jgi:hypothetical protein
MLVGKGEWDASSNKEQQLMVMKAELEELKANKKAAHKRAYKGKGKGTQTPCNYTPDPDWLSNNTKPTLINKIATKSGGNVLAAGTSISQRTARASMHNLCCAYRL